MGGLVTLLEAGEDSFHFTFKKQKHKGRPHPFVEDDFKIEAIGIELRKR